MTQAETAQEQDPIGDDPFEDAEAAPPTVAERFVVDVEGYEGPLDVLLDLARHQKVDLTQISILELADQYLAFVAEVRRRNLELAADYLVMAAWLAYLKSRLLLPDLSEEEEPSGEEMAAVLAFQLRRIEAMKQAGETLMNRAHLHRDFFPRGAPEKFSVTTRPVIDATLYDLMKAYGAQKTRRGSRSLEIESYALYSVEQATKRIQRMLGGTGGEWESLWRFLPEELSSGLMRRSALASTFTASLELAREGRLAIRQSGTFGPIYVSAAARDTTQPSHESET